MTFSLKSFDGIGNADRGATLHLRNPETGDLAYNGDIPLTITVKGIHGNEALRVESDILARARRKAGQKKKSDSLTFEDIVESREQQAEKFARLATAWTGFPSDSGEGLEPFSYDAIHKVLLNYSDILYQVREFANEKKNYPAQ